MDYWTPGPCGIVPVGGRRVGHPHDEINISDWRLKSADEWLAANTLQFDKRTFMFLQLNVLPSSFQKRSEVDFETDDRIVNKCTVFLIG
jgi:hypothetical protein